MKKVAFITTNDGHSWGGSEELWSKAALWLQKNDIEVAVSIKKWETKHHRLQEIENSGGKLYFRSDHFDSNLYKKVKGRLFPYQQKEKNWQSNALWMDEFKPDLVIISLGHNMQGQKWMATCREKGLPYALIVNLAIENKWPQDKDVEPLYEGYTNAKRAFFVAKRNQELTEFQIGSPLKNAEVVRNPFKVNWNSNLPWSFQEDSLKLACVASLSAYHKGHDILFQVLNMPKWRERPVYLTLIGNGPHKQSLMKLKDRFGLDKVTFGGFVDDITEVWKNHQALLMGSRIEGMPLALIEAMLCGRAAIVPDVAGNNEIIDNDINGFLAKAPTVELIDEALERAWQRRDELKDVGEKAAEKARQVIPEDPVTYFVEKILSIIR